MLWSNCYAGFITAHSGKIILRCSLALPKFSKTYYSIRFYSNLASKAGKYSRFRKANEKLDFIFINIEILFKLLGLGGFRMRNAGYHLRHKEEC